MIESEKTYTIEKFIESNNETVSYDSLSLYDLNTNNEPIIVYNLLNEYLDELKNVAVTIELTDKEYLKYQYKPKLLSYDIYGTTELFFVILSINNICNVKEFTFRKLKMLKSSDLNVLLSYIHNNEQELVYNNRNKIKEKENTSN